MNQKLLPEPQPTFYELPNLTINEVLDSLEEILATFGDIPVYVSDLDGKAFEEIGAVCSFNLRQDGEIRQVAMLIPNGQYFKVNRTVRE